MKSKVIDFLKFCNFWLHRKIVTRAQHRESVTFKFKIWPTLLEIRFNKFSACNCYSIGSSSVSCSSNAQCPCKTGYTGKTCSSCSSGYYKSGSYCYGEICLFIIIQLQNNRNKMFVIQFLACNCVASGSSSTSCSSSGQCSCKAGYTGKTCSSCSSGYYRSGSNCYGDNYLLIIIIL